VDLSSFATLAEFAIAQAGFASVVVVLRRGRDQLHPADAFRVSNALVPSILAGFLALLPIGLDEIGVSERNIWVSVSLVFVAVVAFLAIHIARRMRQLPPDAREIISGRVAGLHFFNLGVVIVACFSNATTGLLGPPQGGFYFFGILVLLSVGAVAFVRLVFIRPAA
jgi:hypothetical protein